MDRYDYVIVGAGSAGCVLAARLSEDPEVQVVLVEAGAADTGQEIHVPVAFGQLFQSKWDWDYLTDPEPGLDGRRRYLPRGKMLGGSSSMNAMIYMRGNPADYDEWEALGAKGWGWDAVLPYFLRAEDNERGASELHGAGGPLRVSDGRSRHALMDAFLEAAEQAGHSRNDDFNGHCCIWRSARPVSSTWRPERATLRPRSAALSCSRGPRRAGSLHVGTRRQRLPRRCNSAVSQILRPGGGARRP